jgi:putative hydrolase of the HAD superfamily
MPLRAIIFDYGEVLSGPPNEHFHRALLETSGLPEDLFQKLYWTYRLEMDANILDDSTYWQRIAQDAGTRFTVKQLELLNQFDARMWMDLNPTMLAWAFAIKEAGLKIGILSNMGANTLRFVRRDFSWLNRFDQLTWSCELGVVKPEAAIYRHAIGELGVRPDEALFIDNLEENLVGARAVGLHVLHFTDVEELASSPSLRAFDLPLLPGITPAGGDY